MRGTLVPILILIFFWFDIIFSVILKLVFYIYNTFSFGYFFQNVELGLA
jgi:hypothetical protein